MRAFSPLPLAPRGRRGAFTVQAAAAPSQPAAAPRVVVIGGGWAGFGSTKALVGQGYDVILLDASPNPGGLSAGWRTPQGRAVEAGIKVSGVAVAACSTSTSPGSWQLAAGSWEWEKKKKSAACSTSTSPASWEWVKKLKKN